MLKEIEYILRQNIYTVLVNRIKRQNYNKFTYRLNKLDLWFMNQGAFNSIKHIESSHWPVVDNWIFESVTRKQKIRKKKKEQIVNVRLLQFIPFFGGGGG